MLCNTNESYHTVPRVSIQIQYLLYKYFGILKILLVAVAFQMVGGVLLWQTIKMRCSCYAHYKLLKAASIID